MADLDPLIKDNGDDLAEDDKPPKIVRVNKQDVDKGEHPDIFTAVKESRE